MDNQLHVNVVLWENAWECSPVLLAHRTLLNEMLKYGFKCPTANKSMWRQFISDFLMEILVYGYCIFRTTAAGKPQISSGRVTEIITFNAGGSWRPRIFDTAYSTVIATKGWKVLVHDAPAVDSSGNYKYPCSCVFKALPAIIQYRILMSNMMRRDSFNSAPTVYTTISNNIGVNPSTSRPWFNNINSSLTPGQVTGRVDFRALVQHRGETIESLRRLTEEARKNQSKCTGPGGTADDAARDAAPHHAEHMVTDGRDARESRHLQQDNEIVHYVTERAGFVILQLCGVPPQALGQNVNSERLASSNRLTEMSIQHFRVNCDILKELIETLFEVNGFMVTFGDCVALSTVRCVEQFIKPKRLADMYACALDINSTDIDLNRLKDHQFNLVPPRQQEQPPQNRKRKAGDDHTPRPARPAPRTVPTEEQKDENRKRKADAID
jgi:hypothetical protein